MKLLLDTHFLLWIIQSSARLDAFPWLARYGRHHVSPISILELQFLSEVGKIQLEVSSFVEKLSLDPRFLLDSLALQPLILEAIHLNWTRDPFDRLLSAHSLARRLPLCSVDAVIRKHHRLLPPELH